MNLTAKKQRRFALRPQGCRVLEYMGVQNLTAKKTCLQSKSINSISVLEYFLPTNVPKNFSFFSVSCLHHYF
jgi:hypothetical protein